MKTYVKLIVLAITAILVLALASCGNDETEALKEEIAELEQRVEHLEEIVTTEKCSECGNELTDLEVEADMDLCTACAAKAALGGLADALAGALAE